LVDSKISDISDLLLDSIDTEQVLIVTTPSVNKLYATQIWNQLTTAEVDASLLELACDEASKSMANVEKICSFAREKRVERNSVLVSIGGGVVSDLVTVAASLLRRGIRHIRVPTTLIGLIDAGIGVKGAINFEEKKSFMGCFCAPKEVIVAPEFLKTLPLVHLRGGMAEILKIGFVCDRNLFSTVEKYGRTLIESSFTEEVNQGMAVLWWSIEGMLQELETNLFEDRSHRRLVDFGHTFSPILESLTQFKVHHGEAVAVDMALSTAIALKKDMIDASVCDQLLKSLMNVGLPIYSPLLNSYRCQLCIDEAARHRSGSPNLVVPTGLGQGTFISNVKDLDEDTFKFALDYTSQKSISFGK